MKNLSEQLPLQQGLKLFNLFSFAFAPELSEQLPLQQGLKLNVWDNCSRVAFLSEQLPLQQGLKRNNGEDYIGMTIAFRTTSTTTRIETKNLLQLRGLF